MAITEILVHVDELPAAETRLEAPSIWRPRRRRISARCFW